MSRTNFDRYAADYRMAVNEAVRVGAVDVDRMAGSKVQLLCRVMRQQLGDPRKLKVLDVGCGIGLVDGELVSHVAELHGIDTSQKSLEAAALAAPTAHLRHFDGHAMPYAEAAFDLVFAICVLHHVDPAGRAAFVVEMARVARPGGIVLVLEHNPFNPVTRWMVSRCAFDKDAVLLRRTLAMRLLTEAGLRSGGSGYISFSPWRSEPVEQLEWRLGWLPAGGQYYAWATKTPRPASSASGRRQFAP
jgi:SAM-dependent methyltransferase